MLVFVTVGSTQFDALVNAVLSNEVLDILVEQGYTTLVVQSGNSKVIESTANKALDIQVWKFKPSLADDFARADLVISHAGSGTILDVLRIPKPLIVVPNRTLLDNHQDELANSLSELGHLTACAVELRVVSFSGSLCRLTEKQAEILGRLSVRFVQQM